MQVMLGVSLQARWDATLVIIIIINTVSREETPFKGVHKIQNTVG